MTDDTETSPSEYSSTAVRATNAARGRNGLRRLSANRCLQRFALKQATAMARAESMYHQDLTPILRVCDLGFVGENVAYGYEDGRAVVNAWMHSPGHRANILNRGFRFVAIAARRSADGSWYSSQVFGAQ